MIDWTKSMQQTFEYYMVDPFTWKDKKRLSNVTKCTVTRDSTVETLGSASMDMDEELVECYVRAYLIAVQNGETAKEPLGTFLVQTPGNKFDGKVKTLSADAYTPLIELKENPPPLGYSIPKDTNIMDTAYTIIREKARAPVVKADSTITLYSDFVSNTDDTWLTFIRDLISNAKYELTLDELGRILFSPKQELISLQPVCTYDDGNSSILYPDVSIDQDMYGIPNVIEVVYSENGKYFYGRAVNDDSNSPVSTVNRGREIIQRVSNPSLGGFPSAEYVQEYAEMLLKEISTLEYTVTYKHGYRPTRIGDCVRLNYPKAGLDNVKAKIISQTINCESGCQLTEKAVYTKKLWR